MHLLGIPATQEFSLPIRHLSRRTASFDHPISCVHSVSLNVSQIQCNLLWFQLKLKKRGGFLLFIVVVVVVVVIVMCVMLLMPMFTSFDERSCLHTNNTIEMVYTQILVSLIWSSTFSFVLESCRGCTSAFSAVGHTNSISGEKRRKKKKMMCEQATMGA